MDINEVLLPLNLTLLLLMLFLWIFIAFTLHRWYKDCGRFEWLSTVSPRNKMKEHEGGHTLTNVCVEKPQMFRPVGACGDEQISTSNKLSLSSKHSTYNGTETDIENEVLDKDTSNCTQALATDCLAMTQESDPYYLADDIVEINLSKIPRQISRKQASVFKTSSKKRQYFEKQESNFCGAGREQYDKQEDAPLKNAEMSCEGSDSHNKKISDTNFNNVPHKETQRLTQVNMKNDRFDSYTTVNRRNNNSTGKNCSVRFSRHAGDLHIIARSKHSGTKRHPPDEYQAAANNDTRDSETRHQPLPPQGNIYSFLAKARKNDFSDRKSLQKVQKQFLVPEISLPPTPNAFTETLAITANPDYVDMEEFAKFEPNTSKQVRNVPRVQLRRGGMEQRYTPLRSQRGKRRSMSFSGFETSTAHVQTTHFAQYCQMAALKEGGSTSRQFQEDVVVSGLNMMLPSSEVSATCEYAEMNLGNVRPESQM
ncbi:unnamed protein product [Clavelina lepadiformis]|uniref:Uncharacterized protein n=1 Tax=Clavelina lepadiformis TaxID=159417 RepID=A0ABP0F209_CLALP